MKPQDDDVESLRERLREAEETLEAIRSGQVDALVVHDPKTKDEKVFTLQGSDYSYRTMLEQMGEGAATVSSEGTILYCNRAFARLCGHPMERVAGGDVGDFAAPQARKDLQKALSAAREATTRLELPFGRDAHPVLLTISPLSGYVPPALGIVATDLRLQAKNVELERRVAERTAALKAANSELEAFNYSVSHDLKAPARQIKLYAELLEREHAQDLGADGRKHLGTIKQSAGRLSAIIEGMLALSRATLTELRYTDVDLTAMAESIVEDLARASPKRAVVVKIAPRMTLRGDENLLRLALQNLLANAWKFTAAKEQARIEVAFDDAERTIVRVKDNGAGFDEAQADKIFKPFQRLHAEEFPGTGIGLSIVARVLARHGGRVWARAAVGRGAAFYFQLAAPPEKGA